MDFCLIRIKLPNEPNLWWYMERQIASRTDIKNLKFLTWKIEPEMRKTRLQLLAHWKLDSFEMYHWSQLIFFSLQCCLLSAVGLVAPFDAFLFFSCSQLLRDYIHCRRLQIWKVSKSQNFKAVMNAKRFLGLVNFIDIYTMKKRNLKISSWQKIGLGHSFKMPCWN